MIYDRVEISEDLRQGDIFLNIPNIKYDLEKIPVLLNTGNFAPLTWNEITNEETHILATLEKSNGIILTQDCDCLRTPMISLMKIIQWDKNFETDKNWMKAIIELNSKQWTSLYLPKELNFQIHSRMIIEFALIFQIDRIQLKNLRSFRSCKLNKEALEHFQVKIANYFKRYSYQESYPLTSGEMNAYIDKNSDSEERFEKRSYQQ